MGIYRFENLVIETRKEAEDIVIRASENKKKGYFRVYVYKKNRQIRGTSYDLLATVTLVKP